MLSQEPLYEVASLPRNASTSSLMPRDRYDSSLDIRRQATQGRARSRDSRLESQVALSLGVSALHCFAFAPGNLSASPKSDHYCLVSRAQDWGAFRPHDLLAGLTTRYRI
jgi:hypothetical protein